MSNIIHIVGASGAGTTTLGQALERKYGYKWLDTDGFFWISTDPPFVKSLPHEEGVKLLTAAMAECPKCVISGSLCGWGDVFIPKFDLVIFVDTPTNIRIERLEKLSCPLLRIDGTKPIEELVEQVIERNQINE